MENQASEPVPCAHLVITDRHRNLLLVEKGGICILPGGKIEAVEDDLACLQRELSEELPDFSWNPESAQYWRTFLGNGSHSGRPMSSRTYLLPYEAHRVGNFGRYGAEITDMHWYRSHRTDLTLSAITENVVRALLAESMIA